jgi:hypothetical protein
VPDALPMSVPADHLLPAAGTPSDRLKLHLQGVVEDTKDWVDLRIKLAQMEIEERLKAKLNPIIADLTEKLTKILQPILITVAGAAILGIGALFGLVALSLAIGALLGSATLGFLVVTIGLLIVGGVIFVYGRREMNRMRAQRNAPPTDPDSQQAKASDRIKVTAEAPDSNA